MVGDSVRVTIAHLLRRHGRPVTTIVVVTAIGAALLSMLGGRFDVAVTPATADAGLEAVATTVTPTSPSVPIPSTSVGPPAAAGAVVPAVPVPSAAVTTTTTPHQASLGPVPPISASSPDLAPPTSGTEPTHAQVVEIQTVPSMRDLRIRLGDRIVATDANGALEIPPSDFDAAIEVLGPAAEPALQRIEVLGWSDGSNARIRSLTTMPGPVIQLGLQVSDRIVVQLGPDLDAPLGPAPGVVFDSAQVGQVVVPLDEPTWLIETRAVAVDGALVAEAVEYRVAATDPVSEAAPGLPRTVWRPRPEALWILEP